MDGKGKPAFVLEDLLGAMKNLLSVIDDSASDDEALISAWRKCSSLSDRCRAEAATVEGLDEEQRASIREHLATAARLNAIAAHMVQRESDRVSSEIERLQEARKALREQIERGAEPGGSVDLAG